MAHPVFKTGRAGQPPAWKVRFLRRVVAIARADPGWSGECWCPVMGPFNFSAAAADLLGMDSRPSFKRLRLLVEQSEQMLEPRQFGREPRGPLGRMASQYQSTRTILGGRPKVLASRLWPGSTARSHFMLECVEPPQGEAPVGCTPRA